MTGTIHIFIDRSRGVQGSEAVLHGARPYGTTQRPRCGDAADGSIGNDRAERGHRHDIGYTRFPQGHDRRRQGLRYRRFRRYPSAWERHTPRRAEQHEP